MSTPPPPPMGSFPYGHAPQPGNDATKTLGIVSLVAGVIGIPASCCCPILGLVPGLVAIVTALIGFVQAKERPSSDAKPFLILGLVFGVLSLGMMVLMAFFGVADVIVNGGDF